MNSFVKTLAVITAITWCNYASAQLKLLPVNGISADIKRVIDDHPYHFAHITGDLILENPQSADYQCNFKVNGAEQSLITKYSSRTQNVFAWEATMLTTESFEEARKKYKSLFTQLNGLTLKTAKLRGDFEAPVEEKNFSSVLFGFDKDDEVYGKLKVELMIYSELLEWKVKLKVYDREREDNERGKIVE